MTQNRVTRAILALVLAIALWAFVVGEINPVTKVTLNHVGITFLGESQLEGAGLDVTAETEEVSVTLEGSRSEVRPLKADDVHVYADITGAAAGEHEVLLTVRAPSGTEVVRLDPEEILIKIGPAGKSKDKESKDNEPGDKE